MDAEGITNELRRKRPSLALAADHGNSRAKAIEMHCISCMGGNANDARSCGSIECALFIHAFGRIRPVGAVPTEQEYRQMIESDPNYAAKVARGRALAEVSK